MANGECTAMNHRTNKKKTQVPLLLLGDPLGGAVRAVGRSEGVVDEKVGVGGQLLANENTTKIAEGGQETPGATQRGR